MWFRLKNGDLINLDHIIIISDNTLFLSIKELQINVDDDELQDIKHLIADRITQEEIFKKVLER